MTSIYARQGDLLIRQHKAEGELGEAVDRVVAGGSSHPHVVRGRCLCRSDESGTTLRVEQDTTIEHAGLHKPIALVRGDYLLSVLRERGGVGDREVKD